MIGKCSIMKLAVFVGLGLLILSAAQWLGSRQEDREPVTAEPRSDADHAQSPRTPVPSGLFICRGPEPATDREVDFPFLDGWLVRPGWNMLEPAKGDYDWRYLDGEIATARRLKKKITFAIL